MTLDAKDRSRLVAILGMLGSAFDGERAAAGLMASTLLKSRKLTWDEVIVARLAPPPPPPPPKEEAPFPWKRDALWCLERPDLMTEWERQFAADMLWRRTRPTPKQQAIIDRIVAFQRGQRRP